MTLSFEISRCENGYVLRKVNQHQIDDNLFVFESHIAPGEGPASIGQHIASMIHREMPLEETK
jgi:hypothetical protein